MKRLKILALDDGKFIKILICRQIKDRDFALFRLAVIIVVIYIATISGTMALYQKPLVTMHCMHCLANFSIVFFFCNCWLN